MKNVFVTPQEPLKKPQRAVTASSTVKEVDEDESLTESALEPSDKLGEEIKSLTSTTAAAATSKEKKMRQRLERPSVTFILKHSIQS